MGTLEFAGRYSKFVCFELKMNIKEIGFDICTVDFWNLTRSTHRSYESPLSGGRFSLTISVRSEDSLSQGQQSYATEFPSVSGFSLGDHRIGKNEWVFVREDYRISPFENKRTRTDRHPITFGFVRTRTRLLFVPYTRVHSARSLKMRACIRSIYRLRSIRKS